MNVHKKYIFSLIFVFILGIVMVSILSSKDSNKNTEVLQELAEDTNQIQKIEQGPNLRADFSEHSDTYRFSAELPDETWQIEFVVGTDAINTFNPNVQGEGNLETSQIFIRNFSANSFLTLSTVDILSSEITEINGHDAVRYEIMKKPSIANFSEQPSWRSNQHKLIDIRFTKNNPSIFYVFAYNPALDDKIFEEFINSTHTEKEKHALRDPHIERDIHTE